MHTLTRYLYNLDHVISALSTSILSQSDFEEVLFWADELYTSGFRERLYEVIWTCFYTHFAAVNPLMENYIRRKLAADDPWSVLKNLFHRQKHTFTDHHAPKRGRKPKWLDEFTDNKLIKNVLLSPSMKTVEEYAKHHGDMTPLYTALVAFYKGDGDVDFFTSHSYQIQQLLILSMIEMMRVPEEQIHTKKIYLTLGCDDEWFLGYIRGDIDTDGKRVPAYKLLNERQLFHGGDFTANIWESKELLCKTPIWRERFAQFGEDEEGFCAMYDYQPDDYCYLINTT